MVVIANLGKFLAEMLNTWMKPFRLISKKIYHRISRLFKGKKSTKIKDKSQLQQQKFGYNGTIPNVNGMKHVSFQESNIIPDNESMIETIDRESLDQQIILSSSLSPTTIKNNGNNVDSENPYDEVDEEDDEDDEDYDDEEEEEEEEEDSTHKNAASLFICFVLYLIIGSVIIASYEPEMDVFKAIYYTFVSLTTVSYF
uniref:Potassium channel domain-containing protein n=1 Tax=Panagrolaimus sp. ES5 TaxID=591445 RepID=A0AC34FG77_9BILA